MSKYKWILIGLVLVIAASVIFYGTSVTMCEPPCI
jgi:uncharacterized membrane protein